MTNREEFCALLYGTFYESISDSAIIRQQHEKFAHGFKVIYHQDCIVIGL